MAAVHFPNSGPKPTVKWIKICPNLVSSDLHLKGNTPHIIKEL